MNIGDRMYFVQTGRNQIEETCPDCAGTLAHHIVLGNGDEHDIPCDTCKRGYLGPTGVIQTYKNVAVVKACTITQITMGAEGPVEFQASVFYQGNTPEESGWHEQSFKIGELYPDKAGAELKAQAKTAEQVVRYIKDKKEQHKSWAWHVNYHRSAIRKNLKDNGYHEEQLAYARSKARS